MPALTGARFLAALSIVVFHYGADSLRARWPSLAWVGSLGPAAVSFFYVLSGAVLTWGCTGRDGLPLRAAHSFWTQRARRILPAYWLALALTLPLFAVQVLKLHPGAPGFVRIALGLGSSLLLLQAFWPPVATGLNTPGWSISCEAFFYALWPRLVGRLRAHSLASYARRALALWLLGLTPLVLGLLALRWLSLPPGPFATLLDGVDGKELWVRFLIYFPPFRLPEFALGIVIGHALRLREARGASGSTAMRDTRREAFLAVLLLLAALGLGHGIPERLFGVGRANEIAIQSGLLAPLFGLWVWQLSRGRGMVQWLLARPAMIVLGEASYALYILQEPVASALKAVLKRVSPAWSQRWDLIFWGYVPALVGLALLTHRFIEQPLRKRRT